METHPGDEGHSLKTSDRVGAAPTATSSDAGSCEQCGHVARGRAATGRWRRKGAAPSCASYWTIATFGQRTYCDCANAAHSLLADDAEADRYFLGWTD